MSNRQTASFLIRRFAEAGLHPVTRRGQNFLIDLNLLELLADTAQVSPTEVVFEVGTGLGSLTAILAARAAAVVSVEVDRHLQQLAAEHLVDFGNVTLLCQDALKNKNRLHPNVWDAIRDALERTGARQFKLVANLPYCIATPIVSNLLAGDPLPASMTVTIQKELADRLTAQPGTKAYGALSIWVQSQCDTQIVRIMPPSVFWPRPQVDSAIVHIVPNAQKRERIPHREFFHAFVRGLFLHRRKMLRSCLLSASARRLTKQDVDRLLEEQGLAAEARAEQLDTATLLALCESVRRHLG